MEVFVDFYALIGWEKETFKLGTSLVINPSMVKWPDTIKTKVDKSKTGLILPFFTYIIAARAM